MVRADAGKMQGARLLQATAIVGSGNIAGLRIASERRVGIGLQARGSEQLADGPRVVVTRN